ncbi:hypothetical protein QUF72_01405 [Desulfobacterales bacterium HSG2]|nr:hypothetical protein [Desulfobacterales bacterium HSG2]
MCDEHSMRFKAIFFGNKLKIVNPYATLGIVTLWSETDFIARRLKKNGVDLDPEKSKVAVIGNLYGEGFKYLLRNLLYNPQIDTLLVLGNDRSGSYRYLSNFFSNGTERIDGGLIYKCSSEGREVRAVRVKGTDYLMDSLVSPEMFSRIPEIVRIEGIEKSDPETAEEVSGLLKNYRSKQWAGERILVEIPDVLVETYPSNLRAHTIVEETPARAWKYLVHRVFRFGRKVLIKKGERTELQNVKVVIEKPRFEDESVIRACGFDPESFSKYQKEILSAELPADRSYTYGHRIRAYFGTDCLDIVVADMVNSPDDRSCYISTWDNTADIRGESRPCLVSLFFRNIDNCLHLSSTFRTHNTSNAWLENVYGLMAIQQYVCKNTGTEPGSITVISHSVSLDPQYLDKAKIVYDKVARTNVMRQDPNGYFLITTESNEIVVKHYYGSEKIGEYRSEKPVKIQLMIYRDCAISDINHAIYIGRQLEKAYHCIQESRPYIQED